MDRATEIGLLKRLLNYLETKTTAMSDAPWYNEVSAYVCPERHRREEEILFRKRPLVVGLSCDWPKPGAYRTDDYAGVPILTVRGSDGTLRAFLNGRIDLTQAEAVMDLINSRSERGLQMATRQVKGAFGDEIKSMKKIVVNILANVEVGIDFP